MSFMDRSIPQNANEYLRSLVRNAVAFGSDGIGQLIKVQQSKSEQRSAQKELEHFWLRLGKTAYHLHKDGALEHPAISKAAERIDKLKGEK